MAATKLLFITQPISTVAGYTLQGSGFNNLIENAGIQVGVYNASNVLQTSDTSTVTIVATNSNLPPPVQTNPSTSTSGGTGLTASTQYFYVVTALSVLGGSPSESIASNEKNVTTGLGTTNSNTVNWNAVTGATGYRVYRGTAASAEGVYYTVGAVTTMVDTGDASATAGTPPVGLATLTGTLSQPVINGYATFSDLAIQNGVSGFTLIASDGALTSATSNTFTTTAVKRINPSYISGTITANDAYVGPYRFRGHNKDLRQNTQRIVIRGTFSGGIDVIVVDPDADQTSAANKVVAFSATTPTSQVFEAGGYCDIYFHSTSWTSGTATCEVYY